MANQMFHSKIAMVGGMLVTLIMLTTIPVVGQQTSVTPDTVVLTIHERTYTRAQFEEIAKATNTSAQTVVDRLSTANGFSRTQALADEARRRGLDKNAEIEMKLRMYEGSLLTNALFNAILADVHKDESLARKRYQTHSHIAEERQLRHILIRHTKSVPTPGKLTLEQAKEKAAGLRKRILAGASFAEVARAESDDETTRAKGGDLSFLRKPLLLPEIGDAAFAMKVGDVSEPIKTTEGYHLILLEKIAPPQFEFIRMALEHDIARERLEQLVVSGIKLNPDYFGQK